MSELLIKDKELDQIDESENSLLKPLPLNSEKPDEDFRNYGYFIKDGRYYIKEKFKGKETETFISNFTMKFLYHFIDGTQNTKRLIIIQRYSGELFTIEVFGSDFKIETFETILKSLSCTFLGNSFQLKTIISVLLDDQKDANFINILGYIPEFDLYSFSDSIYINDLVLKCNTLGIIEDDKKLFYLPSWAEANIKNKAFETTRLFCYRDGNIGFKTWAKLIYDSYDINGGIGICFLIMSVFRDIVFKELNFFPYLYLFGQPGVGKTSLIDFLLRVFGGKDTGISLKTSTTKGIARSCTQKRNALVFLKEFDSSIGIELIGLFKNGYDGPLYRISQISTDNKTNDFGMESGVIIDGNVLPTTENAMFDRMIVLVFESNVFSDKSTEAYKRLIDESDFGFGKVLIEILKHRNYFKENFREVYRELYKQLKSEDRVVYGVNISNLPERNLKHIAFILTPYSILSDKIDFPFSFDELCLKVLQYAVEKNDQLNELDQINVFWDAINFEKSQPYCRIQEEKHYSKDLSKNILYLKIKEVYSYYNEYCKKSSIQSIDYSSLFALLTSSNYAFIPSNLKGRDKAHIKKYFGSCYQFSFTIPQDGEYLIIKNKEIYL